jgi:hypothetical protein
VSHVCVCVRENDVVLYVIVLTEANNGTVVSNTAALVDVPVDVGNIADEHVRRLQSSTTSQNDSYNYSPIGDGQLLAYDAMVASSSYPPLAANGPPPPANLPPPPYAPQVSLKRAVSNYKKVIVIGKGR